MRLAKKSKPTPGRVLESHVGLLCRGCGRIRHYSGKVLFKRYYCTLLIYSRLQKTICSGYLDPKSKQQTAKDVRNNG